MLRNKSKGHGQGGAEPGANALQLMFRGWLEGLQEGTSREARRVVCRSDYLDGEEPGDRGLRGGIVRDLLQDDA